MDNIPIKTIEKGMEIESVYYCSEVHERIAKNKKPYCDVFLQDKTARNVARFWGPFNGWEANSFVEVSGYVQEYGGNLQIVINHIKNVKKEDVKEEDFIKEVDNKNDLHIRFCQIMDVEIVNPTIKTLYKSIFTEDFMEKFINSPSADSGKYSCSGGLLLQTCRILESVNQISYSRDLEKIKNEVLLASAVFSMAGKVFSFEESDNVGIYNRTIKGFLYGEVALSYQKLMLAIIKLKQKPAIMEEYLSEEEDPEVDDEIITNITHCVLSSRSSGFESMNYHPSIVVPMTKEAMILAHAIAMEDNISLVEDSLEIEEETPTSNEYFTSYNMKAKRRFYKNNY